MRTTLVLEDELVQEAKHRAVDLGLTLSELVNRALRESLHREAAADEPPFLMVTYGGPPLAVGHSPAELAALLAAEDDAPYLVR